MHTALSWLFIWVLKIQTQVLKLLGQTLSHWSNLLSPHMHLYTYEINLTWALHWLILFIPILQIQKDRVTEVKQHIIYIFSLKIKWCGRIYGWETTLVRPCSRSRKMCLLSGRALCWGSLKDSEPIFCTSPAAVFQSCLRRGHGPHEHSKTCRVVHQRVMLWHVCCT